MDALVWGFTYLFPNAMKGLFGGIGESEGNDYGLKPKDADTQIKKVTNLYDEMFDECSSEYTLYDTSGNSLHDEDVDFYI